MSEEKETMVYVNGKLVPVRMLKKQYPEISLSRSPANVKVIETLTKAQKPLSRSEIAKKAGISEQYARDVLKAFIKGKFVLEFQLGGRTSYFLLTEKGLELSKKIPS